MKCKIVAWSQRVLQDMRMAPSVHFGINIILWEQDGTTQYWWAILLLPTWFDHWLLDEFHLASSLMWKTLSLTLLCTALIDGSTSTCFLGKLRQMRRQCRLSLSQRVAINSAVPQREADTAGSDRPCQTLECWDKSFLHRRVQRPWIVSSEHPTTMNLAVFC